MRSKLFHSLLGAMLLFNTVTAHTYFVSNSGNNANSGSQQAPWASLQYACGQVSAGDSVIVLSGSYSGFCMGWNGESSGTPTDPIVFKANPGATITSNNSRTNDGINLEGVDYIVIEGFTITNQAGTITRAGIRSVVNNGVRIRYNTIDGMGTWGIFTGFSENVTIEYNSCSRSGREHGIYHSNSADNPVIRYNTCFENNGCGIHMNGDESMGGDGIISNATVTGNVIYSNHGGAGINMDGVQNSVVSNNLLYNNHTNSGIAVFHIDGAEGSVNNLFINNTIIMASDGGWAININTASTGARVYNNLLFNRHSFRGGLSIDQDCITGFQSDYNITIDRFSTDWGDHVLDLTEWRAETGQDNHSVVSSPEAIFADIATNNFDLLPTCIAVDAGTSSDAPTIDIRKVARPQGAQVDIGAYEYTNDPVMSLRNDEIHRENFSIYPNPVSEGSVFIESEDPIGIIQVISSDGKIVLQEMPNTCKYVLQKDCLTAGLYIICVHTQKGVFSKRLIRQQ